MVEEEETDNDISQFADDKCLSDSSQQVDEHDNIITAKLPIESKKAKNMEAINSINFNMKKFNSKAIQDLYQQQYIKIEEHTRNS